MIRAGSAARRSFTRSANTGGPLVLDVLGVSAAAAYSLRRLRAAYTGAAVNVRRSSDSTTQDIGFVNGSLDTSALAAFIGAGSGFIAKWYDQSGNVNDAVQATAARQPQLVASTAALNSRPAMLYTDGSAQALVAPSAASLNNPFAAGGYLSQVITLGVAAGNRRLFITGSSDILFSLVSGAVQLKQVAATTAGQWVTTALLPTGAHQIDVSYSAASLANVPTLAWDGVSQAFTTSTQPVGTITTDTGAQIGGDLATQGWAGNISETIVWKTTVPSATQITAIRADQKGYWGTP